MTKTKNLLFQREERRAILANRKWTAYNIWVVQK